MRQLFNAPQRQTIRATELLETFAAFVSCGNYSDEYLKLSEFVLRADKPTERDGPFSTLTLFPNACDYNPISANNPVIHLPSKDRESWRCAGIESRLVGLSQRIGIAQKDSEVNGRLRAIAKHIGSLNQLLDGTDIAEVLLSLLKG